MQLDSILRQAKPDLQTVGLVSLRPARHNGPAYAIVATATGPHRGFGSTAEAGEIFGVFLVDSSLTRVTRTLEILVTPRHLDYDLWIAVNVAPDSIVVCGRGSTYGDQAQRRSYPVDPDSGSQDPARPTPVDVDKGDDPDSVLAHCRFH